MSAVAPSGKSSPVEWVALLLDAIQRPGRIMEAYSRFHEYSIGNQLLALWQCTLRGIEPGPIASFMGWKDVGRSVKKGEKAICLCMPVTCKRRPASAAETSTDAATDVAGAVADASGGAVVAVSGGTFTRFIYRNNWFVLSQTEGADYTPPPPPAWDKAKALAALAVSEIPFTLATGNAQGFARERSVSVSPLAQLPYKTLFHELAHVLLGHTSENPLADDEFTPRNIREVEAEATALICCETLGYPGADYCRGYLQHYLAGGTIEERSAQRIFKAADTILRAGR